MDWRGLFTDYKLWGSVASLGIIVAIVIAISLAVIEGPGPMTAENEWIHPHDMIRANFATIEKLDALIYIIVNEYFTEEERARYYKLLEEKNEGS